MPSYQITMQCRVCGVRWKRKTRNPESADPPCPNLDCGVTSAPIGMDLSLQKAPASIGGNISVKAIDETAKIVMEDYGMTDLKTDVRPSENAAPQLPPHMQAQADNFFAGPKRGNPMAGFAQRSAAAAMRGSLTDPVTAQRSIVDIHRARYKPPVHLVGDDQGRSR